MSARRTWLPLLALALAGWALWVLEGARAGIEIRDTRIGPTPVTHYAGDGPPVVVAHGFAGSREMMQGYALVLAQAGYDVHSFDFEGHGAHPDPMSGDVTRIDGTTRRLVDQTLGIIDAMPGEAPVALVGHSMATDVLVRAAAETPRAGPIVLLSAFSQAITPTHPENLLMITGAWEPRLSAFAEKAAAQADGTPRRALILPHTDHVSILHAAPGREAALEWLNKAYGRTGTAEVRPTGWALLALLAAITLLAAPLARLLPDTAHPPAPLTAGHCAMLALFPAIAAPVLAVPFDTRILPVLVADYLALHLALYGGVQLALLVWWRGLPGRVSWAGVAFLLAWGLGVFGLALDRYGANFVPTLPRLGIIAALTLGAVPFMLADTWANAGAPPWQRVILRLAFLASLAVAVALDFEGLFFLILIAPVIVLFYLTFGNMGRAVAARSGVPGAGLALGLVLGWALGVSFPLFSA